MEHSGQRHWLRALIASRLADLFSAMPLRQKPVIWRLLSYGCNTHGPYVGWFLLNRLVPPDVWPLCTRLYCYRSPRKIGQNTWGSKWCKETLSKITNELEGRNGKWHFYLCPLTHVKVNSRLCCNNICSR